MNKINIALLAGGDSSERGISLQSAAQVAEALDGGKYNVFLIDVDGLSWGYADQNGRVWQVDKNDFSLTTNGLKVLFDYALILIHGTPGEDGKLQGYLDMMGVSYSSSGMVSTVVTFDKLLCKRVVASAGLNLARHVHIHENDEVDPVELGGTLGFPMFIKPNASGSSFGVTKVARAEGIIAAVEAAREESVEVLAEEFIEGREIGCGVMIADGKEYVLPVTEIISKKDFFDYEAKYTPGFSDEITPADIQAETLKMLNDMTLRAYRACNCRGIVRIDFIVKAGVPYFIEVNSIPGMSSGSIVPQQARAMGMTLGELFDIVITDTYSPRK
jgi:D-alanine-D-alanine ligase